MTRRRQLVIVGAGGFGQEIVWAAKNTNTIHPTFDILGYCDDDPAKEGVRVYGYPCLGRPEEVARTFAEKPCFICAIGHNQQRIEVVSRVLALGWIPVTVIDPTVVVAESVNVGEGTYVGAGSILSPQAKVGDHVIINHHCSIGHDSVLEDFVQVAPGGRISGGAVLETGVMLGSNAVVAPSVRVGRHATLGANSFAMRRVPAGATALGVPARVMLLQPETDRGRQRTG